MKSIFVFFIMIFSMLAFGQKKEKIELKFEKPAKPKLVIGIVVDQMRWDYLHRYESKYGNEGFKKLMNGADCTFTYYNYAPTYTGPGHSAIFSGTPPALSGIAGNNWFERSTNKFVYCVSDTNYKTIGSETRAGAMSPHYMTCSSIGDQLKIANCRGSKVFGIGLKDRSAILPAGHAADAAYWYDASNGNMITSSFYMDALPTWVSDFNKKELAKKYLENDWVPVSDIGSFHSCSEDALPYEGKFEGEATSAFPHKFEESKKESLDVIRYTPFGNTFTINFAEEIIKNEQLGKDDNTDLLAISFSAPDYIGHKFGPQSLEIEDCYIRLDQDLASFLKFIDKNVGLDNTLIFLTADHGAAEVPQYLKDMKIPAGILNSNTEISKPCKKFLFDNYQDSTIFLAYENQQIYLDRIKVANRKIDFKKLCYEISLLYQNNDHILHCISSTQLLEMESKLDMYDNIKRGLHPTRSGDICFVLQAGWFEDWTYGTTHGSSYTYDNHVPLLWYGWKIKTQKIFNKVNITDIAATLSQILCIQEPNACSGEPIVKILEGITKQ